MSCSAVLFKTIVLFAFHSTRSFSPVGTPQGVPPGTALKPSPTVATPSSPLCLQLWSLLCRHLVDGRVRSRLQRADVSSDRPAIGGPDLGRVVGHRAESIGDHVEEMSDRSLPQAVVGKRRRTA